MKGLKKTIRRNIKQIKSCTRSKYTRKLSKKRLSRKSKKRLSRKSKKLIRGGVGDFNLDEDLDRALQSVLQNRFEVVNEQDLKWLKELWKQDIMKQFPNIMEQVIANTENGDGDENDNLDEMRRCRDEYKNNNTFEFIEECYNNGYMSNYDIEQNFNDELLNIIEKDHAVKQEFAETGEVRQGPNEEELQFEEEEEEF